MPYLCLVQSVRRRWNQAFLNNVLHITKCNSYHFLIIVFIYVKDYKLINIHTYLRVDDEPLD